MEKIHLKGIAGALDGHVVSLHQDHPIYIGYGLENDIVLTGKNLARRYAMIVHAHAGYLLCSLTSRSGVRVNGYRILNVQIQPGDTLTFGEHVFLVENASSDRPSDLTDHLQTERTVLDLNERTELEPQSRASLHVIDGELSGQSFPLYDDTTAHLGRGPECDIVFQNKRVSHRHVQLAVSPDGFLLRDFESTNGTFVNGRRVTEHRLRSGDEIRLGGQTLRFEELPSADVSKPEANSTAVQLRGQVLDDAVPHTPGVRCPGRCGQIYPFGLEHCPLDGALLVNGRTALS